MKKSTRTILFAAACIVIALVCIFLFMPKHRSIADMAEDTDASMTFFTRFGTTLNIEGELDKAEGLEIGDVRLVMTDDKTMYSLPCEYSVEGDKILFTTSELVNGGIQLEAVPLGRYILLLRVEALEDKSEVIKYYPLKNDSVYEGFTYYSITSSEGNRKTEFFSTDSFIESRSVMVLDTEKTDLPEGVADLYLEIGHGGDDPGAVGWLDDEMYTEFPFNHTIAMEVKRILTEKGYRVEVSHEDDSDPEGYGPGGRAVKCNEVKAKYSLSIHNNASVYEDFTGTEIYAPGNADYTFACLLSEKVVECASHEVSNNDYNIESFHQVEKGVWIRLYNEDDVIETNTEAVSYGAKKPYENLTVMKTNWYYMIREVGGVSTGAYTDGRHSGWPANPFWDSNDTCEGLIVECDYVNNPVSLARLIDHPLDYAAGIAEAFCEYVEMIQNVSLEEIADWQMGL